LDRFPDNLVSIGRAAEVLGVSINTIRRWDDDGKIKSYRSAGGHRQFSFSELQAFKASQPLSTTDVAASLNISPSTVRRLEQQGELVPTHDSNGRRQYTRQSIEAYNAARGKTPGVAESSPGVEERATIHSTQIHSNSPKKEIKAILSKVQPFKLKPAFAFAFSFGLAALLFVSLLAFPFTPNLDSKPVQILPSSTHTSSQTYLSPPAGTSSSEVAPPEGGDSSEVYGVSARIAGLTDRNPQVLGPLYR